MVSWEVVSYGDQWMLVIREYEAQGCNPCYTPFKKISREMAEFLVDNKLAGDLYGALE